MNPHLPVLAILHVACLLVQLAMVRWSFVRGRLYGVFFAATAFYQVVSLLSLQALLRDFDARHVLQAEIIALSGTILLAAYVMAGDRLVPSRWLATSGRSPLEIIIARPGVYLAVVGACLVVITAIMARDGLSFTERTWQQARLDSSYLDSLATLLLFIVFPAAWIAFRSSRPVVSALLLISSLVLFVVYGSRAALLTLPMVVVLEAMARHGKTRIRLRWAALVIAAALALHVAGRVFRGFGIAGLMAMMRGESVTGAELLETLATVDLTGGEAAIFRYFLFVVSTAPFPDAEPLTSIARWVGLYLPGGLVPGFKPVDLTYTIWWHAYAAGVFDSSASFDELLKVIGAGGGGSLHPLIWGEMWANGEWLAIPVFTAALALLLLVIEAIFARLPPVVYVLAAPATLIGYVMVARGNSVIGLGYTAYVLPLALVGYGIPIVLRYLFRGRVTAHDAQGVPAPRTATGATHDAARDAP